MGHPTIDFFGREDGAYPRPLSQTSNEQEEKQPKPHHFVRRRTLEFPELTLVTFHVQTSLQVSSLLNYDPSLPQDFGHATDAANLHGSLIAFTSLRALEDICDFC